MNCAQIQQRLLAAEQPAQPGSNLADHLANCPTCRALQNRLVRIEQQIVQLPVPSSTCKDEFLATLLGTHAPFGAAVPLTVPSPPWHTFPRGGSKERGLRKVSVAFALAASLLVFSFSWWVWPRPSTVAPSRERTDQIRLEERLSMVLHEDAPGERVRHLSNLAKELHREAHDMTEQTERMDQWSRFYARVVQDHLIEQARRLTPDERPALLRELAQSLSGIESEASRWSIEVKPRSQRAAASFDRIARASRQGERELTLLLNG